MYIFLKLILIVIAHVFPLIYFPTSYSSKFIIACVTCIDITAMFATLSSWRLICLAAVTIFKNIVFVKYCSPHRPLSHLPAGSILAQFGTYFCFKSTIKGTRADFYVLQTWCPSLSFEQSS